MLSEAFAARIRPLTRRVLKRAWIHLGSTSGVKRSFPLALPNNFKFRASSVTYYNGHGAVPAPNTTNENEDRERTIAVENPATGEIIQSIACASSNTIDNAINYAHEVFTRGLWSQLPLTTRYQTLLNISNLLRESRKSLAARTSTILA